MAYRTTTTTSLEKLTQLFSQWNRHKPNMPAQIIPLFETFYTDFDAQNDTFKTLKKEDAYKIIENIIATALIIARQNNSQSN